MCTYCETHNLYQSMHVECQFCGNEIAYINTSYLYDVNSEGKILRRYTACNPCRNILDPH